MALSLPPTPTIGSVGRSSEPRPAGGYADKIPLFDVRPYEASASKRGYYAETRAPSGRVEREG